MSAMMPRRRCVTAFEMFKGPCQCSMDSSIGSERETVFEEYSYLMKHFCDVTVESSKSDEDPN